MLSKPLILLFSCKSLTKQNSGINIKFRVIPTPQKQSKKTIYICQKREQKDG